MVLDIDGTLTDGKIYMGEQGEIFKAFNIKDGYGIGSILPQMKIVPVILTGRKSKIVEQRAKELNIKYIFQGVKDKKAVLSEFLKSEGFTYEEVIYMGDDLIDLECISVSGFSACPNDAIDIIKENVNYVCRKKGGEGAVREVIDIIFNRWLAGYE